MRFRPLFLRKMAVTPPPPQCNVLRGKAIFELFCYIWPVTLLSHLSHMWQNVWHFSCHTLVTSVTSVAFVTKKKNVTFCLPPHICVTQSPVTLQHFLSQHLWFDILQKKNLNCLICKNFQQAHLKWLRGLNLHKFWLKNVTLQFVLTEIIINPIDVVFVRMRFLMHPNVKMCP